MAIPYIPMLIDSIINTIPVLAMYFVINKHIHTLSRLVILSLVYTFGFILHLQNINTGLELIIVYTVLVIVGIWTLISTYKIVNSRTKLWALTSGALILCSVIPFVRVYIATGGVLASFYLPLIVVLVCVSIMSFVMARGIGPGQISTPTGSKAYASQTEIRTDIAIKGRSVLSDPNLDEVERRRYQDALNDRDNG